MYRNLHHLLDLTDQDNFPFIRLTTSRYSSKVLLLFTLSRINYIFDPWYRNGSLSDIGGKYTFPGIWGRSIEYLIIFRILLRSKHCACMYLRNINIKHGVIEESDGV